MISIIVPTYNCQNLIGGTLDSIFKQENCVFEVLIMDSCSTDKTTTIAKQYNIKSFIEKDNGIYDAYNKGVERSNYDWVMFMGAGDKLINKKILNLLLKEVDFNTKIVNGFTAYQNHEGVFTDQLDFFDLSKGMPFCHQSAIFHKSLFKESKFDLNYKYASDYDHLVKSRLLKTQIKNVNRFVCRYPLLGVSFLNQKNTHLEKNKIRFNHGLINSFTYFTSRILIEIYYGVKSML